MTERPVLADFLRARREQLQPADVGLPDSGRRRTPGLRREEVATLAGVSVDYLVRLEQGRDVNPSPSILAALAGVLRLTEDERVHLGMLAVISSSAEMCPTSVPVRDVATTVVTLIERLDPTPAFVVGPFNDVLAWNRSWQHIVTPLGLLDDPRPNLARYVFLHPSAPVSYPDWSAAADDQVGRLRAAAPRWGDDEDFRALVADLAELPEFASRWSTHAVADKHRSVKRLRHPTAGELRLVYEVLLLPDDGEQRIITWLPDDERTAAALRVAAAGTVPVSPAQLRVVGDS